MDWLKPSVDKQKAERLKQEEARQRLLADARDLSPMVCRLLDELGQVAFGFKSGLLGIFRARKFQVTTGDNGGWWSVHRIPTEHTSDEDGRLVESFFGWGVGLSYNSNGHLHFTVLAAKGSHATQDTTEAELKAALITGYEAGIRNWTGPITS